MSNGNSPEWFTYIEGTQHGPYTWQSLLRWKEEGRLLPEDLVWREGLDDWLPLKNAVTSTVDHQSLPVAPSLPTPTTNASGSPSSDSFDEHARNMGFSEKTIDVSKRPGFRGWLNRWGIRLFPILVVVSVAVKLAHSCGGIGTGTVTFAEKVDSSTLATTNEGAVFSTGWVNMIVRGTEAFDDTKLVSYYKIQGEQVERILMEHTVDKDWTVYTVPILLQEPGIYDIFIKDSDGDVIAEGTVTIVQQ